MLKSCADHMNLISEHFYVSRPNEDLPAHVQQVPANIKRIADAHRQYRKEIPSLQGKDIRIALDEWNYWYGPHVFGELGTRYFLKDPSASPRACTSTRGKATWCSWPTTHRRST